MLGGVLNAQAQSPAGGTVVGGTASIVQSSSTLITIQQTTPKAIIDWQSFSIGAGNTVKFVQPNASAIALNRVTGNQASQINGSLLANGQVWLLNPNGMLIGAGGQVNVGGFLGTTHSLSNTQFANGEYRFSGGGFAGMIGNQGKIQAINGGYAVLAGKAVRNEGLVQANLGQVALVGAKQFTLDVAGDKLLSFAITGDVDAQPLDGKALVDNTGTLQANGGRVSMSARAVRDVIDMVVNTNGIVQATTANRVNGEIVLSAGDFGQLIAAGKLNASGIGSGETGGIIKVLGNQLTIAARAQLDATGDAGGGKILVGGDWQGALVDGQKNALKTTVEADAVLDASALTNGSGGDVVAWADTTNPQFVRAVAGKLQAKGGALGGVDGRIDPAITLATPPANPPPANNPPADSSTNQPPTNNPPADSSANPPPANNPPADSSTNPPPANNGSSGSSAALNRLIQPQLLRPLQQPIGNAPPNPAGPVPRSSSERPPPQPQGNTPPPPGTEGAPRPEGRADSSPPPPSADRPPRPEGRADAPPPPLGAEGAPRPDGRPDMPPPPVGADRPPRQEGRSDLPSPQRGGNPAAGRAPADAMLGKPPMGAPPPPVMGKAPSPLPLNKPPTPKDTADSGDRTLNSVTPYAQPKPPTHPKRSVVAVSAVAGSSLVQQQALPLRSPLTPGVETRFSGTANSVYW